MDLPFLIFFILRFIGWSFIPQMMTTALIAPRHKVMRRQSPVYGSPQYALAYRWIYALVVTSYLLFNLAHAAHSQDYNFYQLLNVGFDAKADDLKTAFRSFAKQHHPDKAGTDNNEFFIGVRKGYETLMNPSKRFAYDRFGPTAFEFEGAITEAEYLHAGLTHCVAFYACTLFVMIVYAILGESNSGNVWRFLLFFYLGFSELSLYLFPIPWASVESNGLPVEGGHLAFPLIVTILRFIFPRWLPFQLVSFLREVYLILGVAIARVLPILAPDNEDPGFSVKTWGPAIQKLVTLSGRAEIQVARMLQRELTAVQGAFGEPAIPDAVGQFPDDQTMSHLREEMKNYFIDRRVTANPALRSVWEDAVKRQRSEAENDSKGSDVTAVNGEGEHQQSRAESPAPTLSLTDTAFTSHHPGSNSQTSPSSRAAPLPSETEIGA
ncbi:hypothetical protein FRB99_004629 [Tulasnella sp. 403]|nr:hypothetical protein FRB99_004629 [Tulasnella sp. 403]